MNILSKIKIFSYNENIVDVIEEKRPIITIFAKWPKNSGKNRLVGSSLVVGAKRLNTEVEQRTSMELLQLQGSSIQSYGQTHTPVPCPLILAQVPHGTNSKRLIWLTELLTHATYKDGIKKTSVRNSTSEWFIHQHFSTAFISKRQTTTGCFKGARLV